MIILALPQEFLMIKDMTICKKNNTETLKDLYPSWSSSISIHETAKECQLHCASEKYCCGCMMVCNETCKWNAVSDCDHKGNSKATDKQCLSKKPGEPSI